VEEPGDRGVTALVVVGQTRRPGAIGARLETSTGHRPAPQLEVTITPPKVTIPDNSKRGMRLAKVTVRWSNGEPFTGKVDIIKNDFCQFSGMELELSRDTTKADANTTWVCTVIAWR
jgi:hypothetical protein